MAQLQGRAGGRLRGGILGVLGLIEDHRAAIEFDFRSRLGVRHLSDIGTDEMSWGEALRALSLLRKDTTSQFAASMEGWDFPISREALATFDMFDLTMMANSDAKKGRPKPHSGRPFKVDESTKTRKGNAGGRTPEQTKELLRQMREGKIPV